MEEKRFAVITGGSIGIGLATAKKMLERNIDVTILSRTEPDFAKQSRRQGENVQWIKADVSNRNDIERALEQILEKTKIIDILVNNAGSNGRITTKTPLEDAEKIWDSVTNVNLKGAFLMAVAIAPYLRKPGGRIINVSSIGAFTGGSNAGALAYASSKAGLLGLTRALARELSPEGITVNSVAPGFITSTNFFNGKLTEDMLKNYTEQIPVKRAGIPEDIASAIYFLTSSEASYINGEVININGGWLFG